MNSVHVSEHWSCNITSAKCSRLWNLEVCEGKDKTTCLSKVWYLYAALQLLHKQSPKVDCIVLKLQFSDANFISPFGLQIMHKQVHKLAQNWNTENLPFGGNKHPNVSPSDDGSLTLYQQSMHFLLIAIIFWIGLPFQSYAHLNAISAPVERVIPCKCAYLLKLQSGRSTHSLTISTCLSDAH